jgi:hypothetical protein
MLTVHVGSLLSIEALAASAVRRTHPHNIGRKLCRHRREKQNRLYLRGRGNADHGSGSGPVDYCRFDTSPRVASGQSGARRTEGCWMPAWQGRCCTLEWRKSSRSGGGGQCIEIASSGPAVLVRDSRDRSGGMLAFTSAEWAAFTRRIRGRWPDIANNARVDPVANIL